MWFNSIDFLVFILIVLPIYYALGAIRSGRGLPRVLFLLVSSYFFYMYWNPVYILLIVASTVLDYFCGRTGQSLKSNIATAAFKSMPGSAGTN